MKNYSSFKNEDSNVIEHQIDGSIKIAYLILVHRLPSQFKKLFKAIHSNQNHYLIHIDKKAHKSITNDIKTFLSQYENVYYLISEKVVWGGYSMVQAELNGMKFLLDLGVEWDYFINLSGQDFPLKSQKEISKFLYNNLGKNFIKTADQIKSRPDTMNRIDNYFEELDDKMSLALYKREFLENITPYIGGQWMIITRDCCDFLCNNIEVQKYIDYYKNTLIADESFFQTVLMNSSFNGVIIDNDLRAIIWIPDGDIKLRPKTFTKDDFDFLDAGDNLFARKFDDNVDSEILNLINFKIKMNRNRLITESFIF